MKINGIIAAIFILSIFSCSKEEEEICYLGICDWGDCRSQSILNGGIQWKAQYCWFGDLNNGKTIIGLDTAVQDLQSRTKTKLLWIYNPELLR